jgi:hypothetical protein
MNKKYNAHSFTARIKFPIKIYIVKHATAFYEEQYLPVIMFTKYEQEPN